MASPNLIFKGQRKEFLNWLESLKISKYWFDTLNIEDSYALNKEIVEVLKNFNQLDLSPKEKLFTLIEIDSCLKNLCEKLQQTYITSQFPLSDKFQEYACLISDAYIELADVYHEMIQSDSVVKLSKKHITLIICHAFKALSHVLLSHYKIYQPLPQKFWSIYYRLYTNAEIFTVINVKVKINDEHFSSALLVKQILILSLIDTNKLTPQQINELSHHAIKIASYVDLKKENIDDSNKCFGFYFEKDDPPKILNPKTTISSKSLRFINISYVIKVVQFILYDEKTKKQKKSTQSKLLSYIIKNLFEKQSDKNKNTINKHYKCHALIGIYDIIDFLLKKEDKIETARHKVEKTDFQQQDKKKGEIDSLKLRLNWNEKNTKSQYQQKRLIKNLHIINSSIDSYQLFCDKESEIELQIGQAIGIIPDFRLSQDSLEIGLIRRLAIEDKGITINIQLLSLESTLIQVEKHDNLEASEWEIFLFSSPKYDVSILHNKEQTYHAGDAISILREDKKIPCKLGEILNSTPLVHHITLSYL